MQSAIKDARATYEASRLLRESLAATRAPEALSSDGLTLEHVRRHLYARDASGTLHRGADAFAILWKATPGRRWLGRLIALPVVRPLARASYDWFADRLYAWNRRHGRW